MNTANNQHNHDNNINIHISLSPMELENAIKGMFHIIGELQEVPNGNTENTRQGLTAVINVMKQLIPTESQIQKMIE